MGTGAKTFATGSGCGEANGGVSRKLLAYFVMSGFFFTFLATSFFVYREYEEGKRSLQRDFEFVQQGYLPPITNSLYKMDEEQLRSELQSVLKLRSIVHVQMKEELGSGLAVSLGTADDGSPFVREFPLMHDIGGREMKIGTLIVTASMDGIYRELLKQSLQMLMLSAVVMSLVSMVFISVFNRIVVGRLRAVADFAGKQDLSTIGPGRVHIPRSGRVSDELDVLADSINGMLARIETDVEERKRVDAEIRRLNAELERRVVERTIQLESANRELEAFSYSVSHDLRAPLRHIDGFVDLLISRCRESLPEKGVHYLDTIADSARQMGVLIDDLLHFSRTGRAEMRREEVEMKAVMDEALAPLMEANAGRAVEWSIGELPSVQGDSALLRQVWANLLGNALKFTRTRDVARIEVGAREEGGEIVFTVGDNGVGFEMRHAGKLFGVFQRLHSQEEFEGTGIGLATVQRIVARHGGKVWAEAEPDRGARFHFTIPHTNREGAHD